MAAELSKPKELLAKIWCILCLLVVEITPWIIGSVDVPLDDSVAPWCLEFAVIQNNPF